MCGSVPNLRGEMFGSGSGYTPRPAEASPIVKEVLQRAEAMLVEEDKVWVVAQWPHLCWLLSSKH